MAHWRDTLEGLVNLMSSWATDSNYTDEQKATWKQMAEDMKGFVFRSRELGDIEKC
jgi:hypothetical protein